MTLAEARFYKKVTQWDLRLRTGINQTKISLIERGYVTPRYSEMEKLAQALGVTVEQIDWPKSGGFAGGANACQA